MKKNKKTEESYDLIVIGAGMAGLSAAMYAARLGMKTLVLGASNGSEMPIGGVITTTKNVENYPGFESISGSELAEKIKKHAESYKLVTIKQELVNGVKTKVKEFVVRTEENEYCGKTIIFATGGAWRKLNIPGSNEFEHKGVAYCALCDAPLYKNKIAAIVGGANSAVKEAIMLAGYAKKVYIIYRGEKLRADRATLNNLKENNNIEVITSANLTEIKGDSVVRKISLDREFNGSKELEVNGVFVAIGHDPLSGLAKSLGVKLNEKEEIIINHKTSETNLEGVYAAGDVTDKAFKQAIIGVAEGCTAAYSAYEYLKNN